MDEKNDKKGNLLNSVKSVAGKVTDTAVQFKNDAVKKYDERKENQAEKKKLTELAAITPIFEEDLVPDVFQYERIIRFVNYDSRLDYDECRNAVGFYEKTENRKIPTILTKYAKILNLSFYPYFCESVFVADQCIAGKYIEIDEYFNYMKQVRVNELTVIAQSLGARHVEVGLKSYKKSSALSSFKANAKVGFENFQPSVNADKKSSSKSDESVEIWACADFKKSIWNGGPVMPTVLYFKNESDIQSLIQMVLMGKNAVKSRKYSFSASSSSGMSASESADINASLKFIKCNVGGSFKKCSDNESNALLEYTIEF